MHADLSHSPTRRHPFLRALGLASLAIAGLILPFVWDVLSLVNEMPKMNWLQHALAQAPALSWLMMFVWGAAIPGVLLWSMHQEKHHKIATIATMLVLMWVAVTWYVHMPASSRCMAIYPHTTWACDVLQWGYSLSLGIATATYVFTMLAMGFSALGLLAENLGDPVQA